jgi:hypothetical protein
MSTFNCLARTLLFEDKGTFNQETVDGRILVYRNPIRLSTQFRLSSSRISMDSQLKALDKLTQYFFDNRTLDAIVPSSFTTVPTLYEKLCQQKAELKAVSTPQEPNPLGFDFNFEYIALYHSGTLLREESRVKTRTIQMGSVPNGNSGMGNTERSVS